MEEIEENLDQSRLIGQHRREIHGDVYQEPDRLFFRKIRQHIGYPGGKRLQLYRSNLQLDPFFPQPRLLQKVVQHQRHPAANRQKQLQIAGAFGADRFPLRFQQRLGNVHHAVERIAQLVGGIGQKFILASVLPLQAYGQVLGLLHLSEILSHGVRRQTEENHGQINGIEAHIDGGVIFVGAPEQIGYHACSCQKQIDAILLSLQNSHHDHTQDAQQEAHGNAAVQQVELGHSAGRKHRCQEHPKTEDEHQYPVTPGYPFRQQKPDNKIKACPRHNRHQEPGHLD
ncbi:hypothetical protein D3C75_800550 [compost metagenome]